MQEENMKEERDSMKVKIFSLRNKSGRGNLLNTSKIEYIFILTIFCATTFLILIFAHPNSLVSIDECYYLHLGKYIAEGSDYYASFPDGRPIVPSIIAFFFYLGFDIVTVRLLMPIIFMNLALISTYALGKTLFGRKEAFVAVLFLLTFPFFWDFGSTMHVDIPLTVFTTLFLLFFYLGIEEDVKFLPISAIFISAALLTKMSAILILLSAFFYLIIRRKWDICRKKEFIISAMIIPLSFLIVYAMFHVLLSANFDFSGVKSATNIPFRFFEILRLGFAPILVLMIFGISKDRRSIYLCLPILAFFVFWAITGRFFALRHFTPLFPIVGILIATGFFKLLNKYNKKFICMLFILLLVVSFVHVVYLNDYHKETAWGIETLSGKVEQLQGSGKIAIDEPNIGYYLKASTTKDVIYSWTYTFNITDAWIRENNIEYVILSVYGDRVRTRSDCYVHPKFLMIEIPFVDVYDPSKLPQSNYQFQSELYNLCENRYEKIGEIYKGEQKVFVIYKVAGWRYDSNTITEYSDKFVDKGKIYNNGGSEVWK